MVLRGRLLAAVPRLEACGTAPRLRRLCRLLDEFRLGGRRVSYELPVPGRCLAGEGGSDRGRDSRGQGGGGAHVRLRRLALLRRVGPFVGGGRVAGLRGSQEAHTLPALVRRAQPGPVVSADHAVSVAASAARGTTGHRGGEPGVPGVLRRFHGAALEGWQVRGFGGGFGRGVVPVYPNQVVV